MSAYHSTLSAGVTCTGARHKSPTEFMSLLQFDLQIAVIWMSFRFIGHCAFDYAYLCYPLRHPCINTCTSSMSVDVLCMLVVYTWLVDMKTFTWKYAMMISLGMQIYDEWRIIYVDRLSNICRFQWFPSTVFIELSMWFYIFRMPVDV